MGRHEACPYEARGGNVDKKSIASVTFKCPERIFDGPDFYVVRRKRVKVSAIEELMSVTLADGCAILAEYYLDWNLADPVSGEPLDNPHENPAVFAQLDVTEQLPWLAAQLRVPGNAATRIENTSAQS